MRTSKIVSGSFVGLLLGIALATAGCSREAPTGEGTFANELKGAAPRPAPPAPPAPRAPVARVGVPDDGVKVAPLTPVPIAKAGVPDDSVKVAPPTIVKGGVPDDSVKPAGPLAKPR